MKKRNSEKNHYGVWYTLWACISILWKFRPSYLIMQIAYGAYLALYAFFGFKILAFFIDIITLGEVNSLYEPIFLIPFLGYILSALLSRYLWALTNFENLDFNRKFPEHLADMLVRKRASLDLAQLDDKTIANLSTKANDNLSHISQFINMTLEFIQSFYSIVTGILVLVPYSLILVVINLVSCLPEYYMGNKLNKKRYNVYDKNTSQKRHSQNYRSFIVNTKNIREVKLSHIGDYLIEKSRIITNTINNESTRVDNTKRQGLIITGTISLLAFGITMFFLYQDLLSGVMTLGVFTLYVGQLNSMRNGISQTLYRAGDLQGKSLYLQDLFKFLDIQPQLTDGKQIFPKEISSISINNLGFTYPGLEKPVLTNINLFIPRGSKVAIVGENGAGKSTLTKLLLRYYDPTSGSITINDIPLSEFQRSDWYARISYMPQDYNNYPFSLREVVTIGEPAEQFSQERYDRALRISQTDKLIESLPNGDQTILSPQFEGGTELSVGQSQKVAIARVLYRPSEILILDEPTSAIDAISELQIFNNIEQLPDTQTVILISHRFNTVKNADIIVVLEHGTIVESGNHDQLMNNKSRYYAMYTAQKDSYE